MFDETQIDMNNAFETISLSEILNENELNSEDIFELIKKLSKIQKKQERTEAKVREEEERIRLENRITLKRLLQWIFLLLGTMIL